MSAPDDRPPPPMALQRQKAAKALDMSPDHFDRYVRPYVQCVYVGSLRLWLVAELERFLAAAATRDGNPAMMDSTTKAPPRRVNGRGHGNRKVGPDAQAS